MIPPDWRNCSSDGFHPWIVLQLTVSMAFCSRTRWSKIVSYLVLSPTKGRQQSSDSHSCYLESYLGVFRNVWPSHLQY
jgi:hypothetical protein